MVGTNILMLMVIVFGFILGRHHRGTPVGHLLSGTPLYWEEPYSFENKHWEHDACLTD